MHAVRISHGTKDEPRGAHSSAAPRKTVSVRILRLQHRLPRKPAQALTNFVPEEATFVTEMIVNSCQFPDAKEFFKN